MRKMFASSLCKRLLLCAPVLLSTVIGRSQTGDCTGVPAVHGTFVIDKRVPTNVATGTFASFNDAYNHIKCGIDGAVVFNIAAGSGEYSEQLVMNAVTGTSTINTITFNGNGNTISFLATDWENRAVVKLNGTDFTRFNNLVIKAAGTADTEYGYAVQLTNDADDNVFAQCTMEVTAASYMDSYAGVLIASGNDIYDAGDAKCDRNQFLNNIITGGYFGIAMIGSIDYLNTANIFRGNTIRDFYNYGIYLGTSAGTIADSNFISRPARTALADYYGIYISGTQVNSMVSRNRLFNPFGAAATSDGGIFYGLYYDYADLQGDNRAANNIVYNLTGAGSAYGIYNNSSNNLLIAHNTLLIDGAAAAGNGGNRAAGIYLESSLTDVTAVNNLVTVARSGGGSKYAIYQTRGGDGIVTGYNNFYITPAATGAKTGYYAGAELATLAEWKAASGNDTRSVAVDPLFTNIAAGDLVPNSAVLDNKGFFLKVTTDIKGSTRSVATPDIGAYEFTPVACPATPAAGAASVYGAPACAGASVGLSLSGYATGAAQTYQWQYATTETGVYTNLGNVLANSADTVIKAATPLYYRAQVTCAGNSMYSAPVYVNINAALPADTYTIDKNAAAGTPKTFLSFNEAKAALTCGITGPVVFNVAPGSGPYEEQLVLDSVPGTSAVNTITFKGNGNTIHFSANDAQNKAVIKLVKADYIILDSLVVDADGSGAYGYGIQLYNGADNNIVRKCTVIANTSKINGRNRVNHAGIVASTSETSFNGWGEGLPSTGNVFEKDSISGGVYGIVIAAGETLAVNNTIADCKVEDGYSGGIRILYATGTVIANNRLSRPTNTNVADYDGIYTEGCDNVQITGNRITDVFKGAPGNYSSVNGIYIQSGINNSAVPSQVANNIIHLNESSGSLYGIYMSYSYNTRFYHNTLLLENNGADAGSAMQGAYFEGNEEVQFKNNIICVTSTNATEKTAFAIGSGLVTADRNDYYVNNTANAHVASYLGNYMPTLAAWQAAASQDGGSVSIDPDFANPAAGDYTPGRGQADNIGLPVGITKDITGANRSTTTPDAGAVEFAVAPCSGTPVAGTAAISPAASLCLGTPVTLGLTGNSMGGYYLFQWQTATSQTGSWTAISDYITQPSFATAVTLSTWFRCKVVCGTDTVYTAPVQQQLNALMPAGVYTIDAARPANYPPGPGANFQSVTEAVTALQCGIAGNIIFDIAPGTYTEQVLIPEIPGASDTSRITFRGVAGNPAAVKWEYTGTYDNNYVVSLTNASYITIKDISITSLAIPYGRAVVLAGNASADSILGAVITAPAATSDVAAGVYGELLAGRGNVIKNNTITGGLYGVYLESPDYYALTGGHVIEGNTISGFYTNGVLANKTAHLVISNNQIALKGTLASTACGILTDGADSAMIVTGNTVTIENTSGTIRGMLFRYSYNESPEKHLIARNTITAVTGNAGRLHGFNFTAMQSARVINNVINIKTTGAEAYAISASTGSYEFYNNTVQNASAITGAANSVLYASASIGLEAVSRNNIFSHTGGGTVMRVNDPSFVNSDYNTFYTTGAAMFRSGSTGAVTYATLKDWRDATTWDYTSQVYKPAFVSSTDLHPKTDDPEVWAIHGRGVQVKKNDIDFNGQPRPDTLTAGVPDMGAFEFTPAVLPVALTATPAVPAANSEQLFMLGTDTVARIHWGATVPATVTARRYSGVVPAQLPANAKYMYFYTDINTGGGTYNYAIDHYYIDSWQGFIPKQKYIRLAKTDAAGAWSLSGNGTVNEDANILYDKSLTSLYQFTGLFDSAARAQEPPVTVAAADTNNLGTHFWASYPVNDYTSFSGHGMVLYLSAAATDADVTVKIHGTTWSRQYHVPANTVVMTEELPRSGSADARVLIAGVSDRSISVVSTQPVSVNTYTYTYSGGTMLLPVGAYGYDYQALNYKQVGTGASHSFVNVIAAYDSTMVEITPSVPAIGHAANVPFTVMLQEGEVFQLLGELVTMGDARGYDVTGTRIRSIKNIHGKCYPAAVFSGSSGTVVSCKDEASNTGNYMYQQNLPYQAWGKTYLTVPTYGADGSYTLRNVYRVAVKDPATAVKINGVLQSGSALINNAYYEFESTEAGSIEADKPVMVAQYMPSMGNCGTSWGNADGGPEMIYLTPSDQGIKQASFFRNNRGDIVANYLVVVVPDAGLSSLLIDGRNRFDATYPHAMQGYTVVMKRWDAERIQSTVTCDTTFTGITYGVGQNESYGFNLGISRIRALVTASSITKTLGAAGNTGNTTCAKAPVRFYFSSSIKPGTIEWKFSKVAGLSPAADSIQYPATVLDSAVVDGRWMYRYSVNADFTFSTPGTYYVPVAISGTDISSCDNTLESFIRVVVTPAPEATDFTISFPGCAKQQASFTSSAVTNTGEAVTAWKWTLSNGLGYTTQNFTRVFDTAGTYSVHLHMITPDGCLVDSVKELVVKALPALELVNDTVSICPGVTDIAFAVANPVTGTTYNWYTSETGTTPTTSGATVTVNNVTTGFTWYAEAVANGCASNPRVKAVAIVAVTPGTPVVTVDSAGLNVLRFAWAAVSNAAYYKVSVDNGATWTDPSSGPDGLTHTLTGLVPGTSVTLLVRAYNEEGCVYKEGVKQGAARSGKLFVPNSFTPNGDGLNDVFRVLGTEGVRQFRFMIFNQWGEKVFETADAGTGWDGRYKGSLQPSGVYIYVCTAVMADTGEKTEKKGSLNLVR